MLASVRVLGTDGAEIMPEQLCYCEDLVVNVRAALGHRPSRPVELLLGDAPVDDDFRVVAGDVLEFTASIVEALSEEERTSTITFLDKTGADGAFATFATLKSAYKDDPEIVRKAVELSPECLRLASRDCRRTMQIVLEAVQQDARCIGYTDDRSIVLQAVKLKPLCLEFAEESFRSDWAIVLKAVEEDAKCIRFASDRDVVLEAVRLNPWCLEHVTEDFGRDVEIVLQAVSRVPETLVCACYEARRFREIVRVAVALNPWCLDFVADELRGDPEIVAAAYAAHRAEKGAETDAGSCTRHGVTSKPRSLTQADL